MSSLGRLLRLCGCFVGCFGLKSGVYWFLEFRGRVDVMEKVDGDRGIATFRSFMSCLTYAYRSLGKSEELREICWNGLYTMLQKLSGFMSSSVFPMHKARLVEAYKLSGRTDSIIPDFEKAVERFPSEGQVL